MDTSGWVYEAINATDAAPRGGVISVPLAAGGEVAVYADDMGHIHVPQHLAGEVIAWLVGHGYAAQREEILTPSPDLSAPAEVEP